MSTQTRPASEAASAAREQTNGAGAAAILAAGVGCFLVAVLAALADKPGFFRNLFIFWRPTGPLSGVTTTAIVAWLAVWAILHARWRARTVALGWINAAAFVLLVLSFLLTFPPIANLF